MTMNVYNKFVLSDVSVSEGEMFIAVLFWTIIISLIPRPSAFLPLQDGITTELPPFIQSFVWTTIELQHNM